MYTKLISSLKEFYVKKREWKKARKKVLWGCWLVFLLVWSSFINHRLILIIHHHFHFRLSWISCGYIWSSKRDFSRDNILCLWSWRPKPIRNPVWQKKGCVIIQPFIALNKKSYFAFEAIRVVIFAQCPQSGCLLLTRSSHDGFLTGGASRSLLFSKAIGAKNLPQFIHDEFGMS